MATTVDLVAEADVLLRRADKLALDVTSFERNRRSIVRQLQAGGPTMNPARLQLLHTLATRALPQERRRLDAAGRSLDVDFRRLKLAVRVAAVQKA
jgi:hypothetical protein